MLVLFAMVLLPTGLLSQANNSDSTQTIVIEQKCSDHFEYLQIEADDQLKMLLEILEGMQILEIDSLQYNEW